MGVIYSETAMASFLNPLEFFNFLCGRFFGFWCQSWTEARGPFIPNELRALGTEVRGPELKTWALQE
jgi:hypothetical protein